jgi:hypothetical protein
MYGPIVHINACKAACQVSQVDVCHAEVQLRGAGFWSVQGGVPGLHAVLCSSPDSEARYDREDHATDFVSGKEHVKVTFRDVYDQWKVQLHGAFANCKEHNLRGQVTAQTARKNGWWFVHKDVPVSAYKPTDVPFFVTIDNAPCHSFWLGTRSKSQHMEHPGVPCCSSSGCPPMAMTCTR